MEAQMTSTSNNLAILQKAEEGLRIEQIRSLNFRLVGAVSVYVEPERWRMLVEETSRVVRAAEVPHV
jgi:hypothetical protein